jgi:hypothetical protein
MLNAGRGLGRLCMAGGLVAAIFLETPFGPIIGALLFGSGLVATSIDAAARAILAEMARSHEALIGAIVGQERQQQEMPTNQDLPEPEAVRRERLHRDAGFKT